MKVLLSFLVGSFLLVAHSGCTVQAPVVPPIAGVYTDISAPLDIDFKASKMGLKKGEASSMCVLGLVAVGDASSRKAAENGKIATIHTADYRFFSVLGIYATYTTVVYGD
jgi:hypothetical protein